MQEAGDRVGADGDAESSKQFSDLGGCTARPAKAGDGISSSVVFKQGAQDVDYIGRFFSIGGRPPPRCRTAPVTTS